MRENGVARNPFDPTNPLTTPVGFVGRHEQLASAIDALRTNVNVMITGFRGIGKTSLADQVVVRLRGDISGISQPSQMSSMSSFIGVHVCVAANTLTDIVEGLLASLERHLNKRLSVTLKGELNIGVLKASVEFKPSETPQSANVQRFVSVTSDLVRRNGPPPHIVYFIDEIDTLAETVDLGSFVKATKEALRAEGIETVSFLLVGQTGAAYQLIKNHPSVGRTLAFFELPRMTDHEVREIIQSGSARANIEFDSGVIGEIVRLSKGFPAIAQLLGSQCVSCDSDGYIDVLDFEIALSRSAAKLRAERYVAEIQGIEDHLVAIQILEYLCDADEEVVSHRQLIDGIRPRPESELIAAEISLLEQCDLVRRVDTNSISAKDKLIAIYYLLKTVRLKATALIKQAVSVLGQRGFDSRVVSRDTDRIVDIFTSKRVPFLLFFKRTVRLGIACFARADSIPQSWLTIVERDRIRILRKNNLDAIVVITEFGAAPDFVERLNKFNLIHMSIDELQYMRLENY